MGGESSVDSAAWCRFVSLVSEKSPQELQIISGLIALAISQRGLVPVPQPATASRRLGTGPLLRHDLN